MKEIVLSYWLKRQVTSCHLIKNNTYKYILTIHINMHYNKVWKGGHMKNIELIKILKKANCELKRHGSSHDIWFSPITGQQFTVPRHKDEIKTGTVKSILKSAGID